MKDQLAALTNLRDRLPKDTKGQLKREVALLMMHLGWTEHKVMSLPRDRRQMYFRDLCQLYGNYDEAYKAVTAEKNKEQWMVIEMIERYEKYVTDDSSDVLM